MKTIKVLPLILILLLSPACLFVPVPQSSEQGDKIYELLDRLVVGITTKEEVISIMGEPDESSESSIVYWRREYSGGYRGYFLYGRPFKRNDSVRVSETEPQSSYIDLFFEFDHRGVLTRFNVGNDDVRESYGFPKLVQTPEDREMQIQARCFSGCDDSYHTCANSDNESSPCDEDKWLCHKSCQKVERLKKDGEDICLRWETGKYISCNNRAD